MIQPGRTCPARAVPKVLRHGTTMVEYALLLALLATASVVVLSAIGTKLAEGYRSAATAIDQGNDGKDSGRKDKDKDKGKDKNKGKDKDKDKGKH